MHDREQDLASAASAGLDSRRLATAHVVMLTTAIACAGMLLSAGIWTPLAWLGLALLLVASIAAAKASRTYARTAAAFAHRAGPAS